MNVNKNPFYSGTYNGHDTFTVTASDRQERVKTFTLKQCLDALELSGLQKTVETAIKRRMRALAAEQDHLLDYSAALKHMDLSCLVLGAWRYWMYRTTIHSYAFLKYELPAAWPHLPENVRTAIVRDIQSGLDIAPEHCPVPAENIPLLEAILLMASMPKTYQR